MKKNELQNPSSRLPVQEQAKHFDVNMSQTGDGKQIGYVNKYESHDTVQVVLTTGRASGRHGSRRQLLSMNTSCFNLFVTEGEDFEDDTGTFIVETNLALTCSIDDGLKRKYSRLDTEAREEVMTFPAIFTSKNHHFGYTDEDHYACYGMITGIERDGHHIIISYHILGDLQQQILNDMADALEIQSASDYNELNDPHWTIKRTNLIALLKERGINLVTVS